MDFGSTNAGQWREALDSYQTRIESLGKPDLVGLDSFYRSELPLLLRQRNPNSFITKPELQKLMQWKLSRGKWRPRLLDFVAGLDEESVKSASMKAFGLLPDVAKAVAELTVLKGVGPATALAVLAAYAPDVAPFMSDEVKFRCGNGDFFGHIYPSKIAISHVWKAMIAALGNSKEYTLKQYLLS